MFQYILFYKLDASEVKKCIGFIQPKYVIDWFNQGLEYEEWRLFQNLTRVARHQLLDKAEEKEVRHD